MSIAAFLSHLSDESPTFRCYACGDETETLALSVNLTHSLEPPAEAEHLHQLRNWLGPRAEEFVQLYSLHDGFTLYEDPIGDAEGIRFYSIEEWGGQTEDMQSQFVEMGFTEEEFPAGILDALAFAEIPQSGNYFTVKLSGPDAGKIFYADHDDFLDEPFADTLGEFLARIANDPPQFLYDAGCYARYSDGKTSTQWIPQVYSHRVTK